jgi:hypothetical protein
LPLVLVVVLTLTLDLAVGTVDEDVDAAVLGIYGAMVVIFGVGELGDDVPCVEEAGNLEGEVFVSCASREARGG